MKNFVSKKVDKELVKLGYKKVHESNYVVRYEKHEDCGDYTHNIDILHKRNIKSIVQSYDACNRCVGMTAREMWLCYWKMWCKGWN